MFKFLFMVAGIVGFFAGLVFLLGYSEQEVFQGSITEVFDDDRETIWNLLITPTTIADRKNDVISIEILSNNRGLISWKEVLDNGGTRIYQMVERKSPNKLVVELSANSDPYIGRWTYLLTESSSKATQVTITEESITTSPWLRGLNSIRGRDVYLLAEMKSIRVGLFQNLLKRR